MKKMIALLALATLAISPAFCVNDCARCPEQKPTDQKQQPEKKMLLISKRSQSLSDSSLGTPDGVTEELSCHCGSILISDSCHCKKKEGYCDKCETEHKDEKCPKCDGKDAKKNNASAPKTALA